jgi:hypothetical protein
MREAVDLKDQEINKSNKKLFGLIFIIIFIVFLLVTFLLIHSDIGSNYNYGYLYIHIEYNPTNYTVEEAINILENNQNITNFQYEDTVCSFEIINSTLTSEELERFEIFIALPLVKGDHIEINIDYHSNVGISKTIYNNKDKQEFIDKASAQYEIDKAIIDRYIEEIDSIISTSFNASIENKYYGDFYNFEE